MKLKIDNFVIAILVVILLAYYFPWLGGKDSFLPLDEISTIGISLIFFFYGLKLSPDKIKNGLHNWRLHVIIQLSTFLLFPLIVMVAYPFVDSEESKTLWLAFMFLASLPSTVSSSVVMVSLARGNIPAAIFNASISGLIGIIVTPIWMGLFIKKMDVDFNMTHIYTNLLLGILLPVICGILLQKHLGNYAQMFSKQLTIFDKTIILLIIFKSFAASFEDNLFSLVNPYLIFLMLLLTICLFYIVFYITGFLGKFFNFNAEDQITTQFCGTKKSLVHGTVFSKILFPSTFPIGILLLPLMVFHAIQILIISVLATNLSNQRPLD